MAAKKKAAETKPSTLSAESAKKIPKIVTAMTQIRDTDLLRSTCRNDFKIPDAEIGLAIDAARAELVKAADFHVTEEYAKALIVMQEMFVGSTNPSHCGIDYGVALKIRQEIHRLQGLYGREKRQGEGVNQEAVELEIIREQLQPFGIQNDESPVAELTRLLLIDYMRLKNEADATRPAPGQDGGAKLSGVPRKTRTVPTPPRQRPGKKSGGVKQSKGME